MSSHQMTSIEEFCSDVVIMNKGKSIFLLLCLAIFCIFTGCKSNDEIKNEDEHEIKHEHTLVFNEESESNCTH